MFDRLRNLVDRRHARLPASLQVAGWVFSLVVILVFAAAFNTAINLFYLLAAIMSSFLLVSLFYTLRNLRKVEVHCEAPRAVHREDPLVIQVRVENHKRLLPSCSLRLHSSINPGESLGYLLKVPARRAAVTSIRETMPRRGVYRLPAPVIESSFPFGLMNRRRVFTSDREIIVYPRVSPVRSNAVDQAQGSRFASHSPSDSGDEFYGLREYIVGDDLRRIAWRASARLGKWVIREMAQDHARFVVFAIDTRRDDTVEGYETRFEEMMDLVASLSLSLLRRQYDISIETPEDFLAGGTGTSHERRILDLLARIQPCSPGDHADFDNVAKRLGGQRAALILVTPDPTRWGARASATSVRYLDPREVINA